MLKHFAHILLLFTPAVVIAQRADSTAKHKPFRMFSKGEAGGFVRSFTMATLNEGNYRDFISSALGGAVHYYTPYVKGIRVGAELLFATELASNNLLLADSASGSTAKWEMELYDIETPQNRRALMRLNTAFIEYSRGALLLRVGRQRLNTPLLNARDGRMMPFQHGGITLKVPLSKQLKSEWGFIRSVSVRSTTSWYSLGDAIGMVSRGKTEMGETADYRYKTGSNGLFFGKVAWSRNRNTTLEVWDFYIDGLNNTIWIQAEKKKNDWLLGTQFVLQQPAKGACVEYLQGSGNSTIASVQIERKLNKKQVMSIGASRVGRQGKFLFPRELGRESLYTSLQRSWMEGLGGTSAVALKYMWQPMNLSGFEQRVECAVYDVPSAYEYALNKYAQQDHVHLNLQSIYTPSFASERLRFEFLYTYRHNLRNEDSNPQLIVNKTNFNQFNFIINAHF